MRYGEGLRGTRDREGSGYVLLCLLVNTACALLAFGLFLIRDGGLLVIGRDFNEQQLVFSMFSNRMIRDGLPSWVPQVDIGSSFIGSMGFYTLGSPWFWCSVLFPPRFFPYIAGWLYVTKYAVAGLTSFLFIRRYVKNGHSAVLGSVLYAFCGFQSSNLLFYHFHDVTALFPLMLIGLDELVLDKKKGRFALFVCLNVLVNYFFFIGEFFFLVLYYVIRFLFPLKKESLADMLRCLAEGILGGAMGMVLLLPSLLSVLQNSRATSSMAEGLKAYNLIRYLAILRSVLLPGEMMSAQASLYPSGEWTSCSAYLPGTGAVLVGAFIIGKKKHWLSVLLEVSAVIAMFPWLNGIFCLYSGWYCRWYYMPLLFASLASALVMDEPSAYRVRKAAFLVFAATAGFVLAVAVVPEIRGRETMVARRLVFAAQLAVALGGVTCTALFLGGKAAEEKDEKAAEEEGEKAAEEEEGKTVESRMLKLYVLVCSVSVLTTAANIALYQRSYDKDAGQVAAEIHSSQELKAGGDELITGEGAGFRVGEKNNNLLTMASGLPSAGSFCSTVSGSILRFYEALGLERAVESPNVAGEEYLLSEAYSIERLEDADGKTGYRLERTADTYPIGFTYDGYMTASELGAITGEDENETAKLRAEAMLTALVVRDEDEPEVEGILKHQVFQQNLAGEATVGEQDDVSIAQDAMVAAEGGQSASQDAVSAAQEGSATAQDATAVAQEGLAEQSISDTRIVKGPANAALSSGFKWNRVGFSCEINTAAETYAFFSVPHDKGWSAYVNGEKAKLLDVCGLMAVRIPEGGGVIRFVYRTPGFRLGLAVSAAAWLVWIFYRDESRIFYRDKSRAFTRLH